MALRVEFHPLAEADLFDLYDYIERRSGPVIAGGYIDRIEALCGRLATLPERGAPRSDLGAGVRTLSMERRVLVIYRPGAQSVVILRVLYGGRDFSSDDVPQS